MLIQKYIVWILPHLSVLAWDSSELVQDSSELVQVRAALDERLQAVATQPQEPIVASMGKTKRVESTMETDMLAGVQKAQIAVKLEEADRAYESLVTNALEKELKERELSTTGESSALRHRLEGALHVDNDVVNIEIPAPSGRTIHVSALSPNGDDDWPDIFTKGRVLATTAAASNATRMPVLWLHLSKSGGTTMCRVAQTLERVVTPETNCNWLGVDFGQASTGRTVSCVERAEFFKSKGFTYGQIERKLVFADDFCPDSFTYGTMLRDPVHLALSRMHYADVSETKFRSYLQCVTDRNLEQCNKLGPWPQWSVFDNFAVRIITGMQDNTPGVVTEQDAEAAIQILSNFAVVGILENVPDTLKGIKAQFGWDIDTLPKGNPSTAHSDRIKFTAEEARLIRDLNKHDYKVYEHFQKLLSNSDWEKTQHAAAATELAKDFGAWVKQATDLVG